MEQVLKVKILENFGGSELNDLVNVVQEQDNETEDINTIKSSIYLTHDSLKDNLDIFTNKFTILSINCQSLFAKFDSLNVLIKELKLEKCQFSAICLQETWLSKDSDLSFYQIEDYTLISKGHQCTKHGGLAIYLHKKYMYTLKSLYTVSDVWEGLFIEITNLKQKLTIGNVYRPPKENNKKEHIEQFIYEISPILADINSRMMLIGDFNIDLLKIHENNVYCDFYDTLISNNFKPTITLPTRFSQHSASLIDNIFINFNTAMPYFVGTLISNISDHLPSVLSIECSTEFKKDHSKLYYRKCNDDTLNFIYNDLMKVNIIEKLNTDKTADPNENYAKLEHIIILLLDKHMPLKKIKSNKYKDKRTEWITTGIIRSIKYRDKLYKSLKLLPINTVEHSLMKTNLKTYNKILKKLINNAKHQYYTKHFHINQHNTKKTWETIKTIIGSKRNDEEQIQYLSIINNKITNKLQIAEHFNQYFGMVGESMASDNLPPDHATFKKYLTNKHTDTFNFTLIKESDTESIIKSLSSKNSSSHDGITSKLLKKLCPILIKPLTLIMNQSLKIAKIIPIHKKEKKHLVENYRPISILLPTVSKVFERVVFNQIYDFFSKNNLFYPSQYGFCKKHSTEYAALETIDIILQEMDKETYQQQYS